MKAVFIIVVILASCTIAPAENPRLGPPRDFDLNCTPTDTNKAVWVASLRECGTTNTYQFSDLLSLKRFVNYLPDRSRIWYGFEEPPEAVFVGRERMDTHAFRAFCNFKGVILSWKVGW